MNLIVSLWVLYTLFFPTLPWASPIYASVFLSKSDLLNFAMKTEVISTHSIVQDTFYLITYLISRCKYL